MTSEEVTTAMRLCMGLPHPLLLGVSSSLCICGKPWDNTGVHLLRYSIGGETISVHDAVKDTTAQILSDTLVHARHEVSLDLPGPPPRHVCVDLTMVRDDRRTLADIVVANPLRQDIIATASSHARSVAIRAATQKEEKYLARAPSDAFMPLAIEIFGRLHHQFDGLLRQATRDIHSRGSTGASVLVLTTYFRQRLYK
ncbi:unnamed protein product [Calypogeia fissa]